jgi:MOSC domain-containing protein YiiM
MNRPVMEGMVLAISSDHAHRFSKPVRSEIMLIEGHGVEGDTHAGPFVRHRYLARRKPRLPNLRQVHLIPAELFDELGGLGYEVLPGELGENVTTVGTLLKLGATAAVELKGLRTPCVLIDRFRNGLKRHMIQTVAGRPKFRCGVLGIVTAGGRVTAGDPARAEMPSAPWRMLPAL